MEGGWVSWILLQVATGFWKGGRSFLQVLRSKSKIWKYHSFSFCLFWSTKFYIPSLVRCQIFKIGTSKLPGLDKISAHYLFFLTRMRPFKVSITRTIFHKQFSKLWINFFFNIEINFTWYVCFSWINTKLEPCIGNSTELLLLRVLKIF